MSENSSSSSSSGATKKSVDLGTDSTLAFFSLVDWFEKNRSKVFMGLVILSIVVIGIYGMNSLAASKQVAAANALATVDNALDFADPSKGPGGSDYQSVADSYPGSRAGARALLLAGRTYFEKEKFTEARNAFQQFLTNYQDEPVYMIENARYGLARSEEALGNNSAALKEYQNLADAYQASLSEASRFAAARLLEAGGDLKAAYLLFDSLSLGTGFSYWTREASVRKQEILKKDPSAKPAEVASSTVDLSPKP